MVKLFAAGFFDRTPRLVRPRLHSSPNAGSPRKPRLNEPHGPDPPGRDYVRSSPPQTSPALIATALIKIARILRPISTEVFLRRPLSPPPPPWDRTHGLLLPTWEGITRKSLPRTGRATLMASSSTGEQHRGSKRPSAEWLVPHALGRLAPALPGMLHPTSTMPSHVFRAGLAPRTVQTGEVQVPLRNLK
jgi:hypothetical protein